MNELVTSIPAGLAAFSATNIDDILILLLFFSQVNATFRRRHIVMGQYLGFAALVIASLPGFFGGLILPRHWIGLLGLVPIGFGLMRVLNTDGDSSQENEAEIEILNQSPFTSFLSPQAYSVAAVTVANGSDNIGIYVPLFASSSVEGLVGILGIFFLLVGFWCYAAYKLTHQRVIAHLLSRHGSTFVPFILIGLGVFIVLESQALTPLALGGVCLCLAAVFTINSRLETVVRN
ncbi:MAG TPA: cadmium resistance transporter [Stenomitos sp.]